MAGTELQTITLPLEGMTCSHCVRTVERALTTMGGVRSASVDLHSQSALVTFDAFSTDRSAMEGVIASVGYAPRKPGDTAGPQTAGPVPDSAARSVHPPPPVPSSRRLAIEGLTCASCVQAVERASLEVSGVSSCNVSLADGSAEVRFDPTRASLDDVIRAIRSKGYGAREVSVAVDPVGHGPQSTQAWRRVAVSAAFTTPVLVLAMSHGSIAFDSSHWVQLALTLPVVVYGGTPFYTAAWKAACHGRSDMNTLVAVGTGAAFVYSVAATAAPAWVSPGIAPEVYFETSAAILTIVLLGRALEARARHRTSDSIRKLLSMQARWVRVRRNGRASEIPLETVAVGDQILVRPGERIPVDGTVIEGAGAVDESPVTGESVPADKAPGSRVISGSLNKDGFLAFRAESVGSETALARLVEFVRRAQASKAPAARLADRIASVFVPVIMVVAALTFGAWMVLGPPDDRLRMALNGAVSVLIVACPCALGLATPMALAVGIGRAAENGILIRDGMALESARKVDTVVFDKTGTLTHGQFAVSDVDTYGSLPADSLLHVCSAIESLSEHPIARAIATTHQEPVGQVADYRTLPGAGATAMLGGHRWLIGKPDLIAERGTDISAARTMIERRSQEGKTVVLAARDGSLAGTIALRDTVRPESAEAVAVLHDRRIRTLIVSGDREATARAVAAEAGIHEVLAPVMPVDKANTIQRLQSEGRTVAMVGDGINDAAALAQSDLGIAIGAGTDTAAESASIILARNDLRDVPKSLALAKRIQQVIRQNYWWAFGYNVLGVPVAAGVLYPWFDILLSPIVASAAMALSSLSVVANSLRLRRSFAGPR